RLAQRPRAANERRIARQAAWITGSRETLLGIEPLQLDAFVAAGKHALVEGCTLEVRFDLLSPRRVIDLGEVGSELELFRNRDHTVSPHWSEIVTVIGQRFHPADGDTNPDVSLAEDSWARHRHVARDDRAIDSSSLTLDSTPTRSRSFSSCGRVAAHITTSPTCRTSPAARHAACPHASRGSR